MVSRLYFIDISAVGSNKLLLQFEIDIHVYMFAFLYENEDFISRFGL